MVNIGLIGCGKIADRHLNAYRHLPGVEVAVFDVDLSAAQRRASEFNLEYCLTMDELLERPGLDAVDVCVPTPWHKETVIAALQHRKHVFCEKPLAASPWEAEEIREALRCSGTQLAVGYPYRFYPAFQHVKQLLDDGIIGRPYLALFRLGGRGDAAAWKHRREDGGGAVLEMMVHELDLLIWFFGEITATQLLFGDTLLPERHINQQKVTADAEDCVLARLRAAGVEILCQSDLATPSYMNHIEILGDNGSIFSSMLHYLPTQVYCREPRGIYDRGATSRQFPIVNVFELELAHFVSALRAECDPINTIDESIHLLRVVDQLRGAADALMPAPFVPRRNGSNGHSGERHSLDSHGLGRLRDITDLA